MAKQKKAKASAEAGSNSKPGRGGAKSFPAAETSRRGPSVAALAALSTLAGCLWFEVELSSALFRAVLVYLGVSLLALLYRVILGHYLSVSQERAQQEFLERMQREAEEEAASPKRGAAAGGKSSAPEPKAPKAAEAVKT
jgi:hypothetical protein